MTTYIDPQGNEIDSPETQALAGERLLDDICDAIGRYCILPGDHEYIAVTLWCAYTHLSDVFDFAPRLIIRSPEMRSGKTRLLEVVTELVRKPLASVNASPATIFRSLEEDPNQTFILDEVDAWFTGNSNDDSFRGLINAGFQRGGAVLRMGGKNMTEVQRFNVFAPVAMAGIGRLPYTIEDRSVIVMMRRKAPHEKVDPYRLGRDRPGLRSLRDRAAQWAKHVRDMATRYASYGNVDLPVDDRQADVWEPLLVIAQLAGGNWPDAARETCRLMCAKTESEDGDSTGQMLLGDIRDVFGNSEFIRSAELTANLKMLHDSPWFDEALTPARLASKLRGYGIHPRHSADKSCRGYYRVDFRDAWTRYLPENPSRPSESSGTGQDCSVDAVQLNQRTSANVTPSMKNTSSNDGADTSDTMDGFSKPIPTPRDVANLNAKGKRIFESGKYAPKQQMDFKDWA